MNFDDLKFEKVLEIKSPEKIAEELLFADLTNEEVVNNYIADILALFVSLDLETAMGRDFRTCFMLIKTLLEPLLEKCFIFLKHSIPENDRSFLFFGPEDETLKRLFEDGFDGIFFNGLLLDAHVDVVGAPVNPKYFQKKKAVVMSDNDGEYVFARGSNDMLTQVSVLIILLYRCYQENIPAPYVTISMDEELSNVDQKKFYRRLAPKTAISLEPTAQALGFAVNEILKHNSINIFIPEKYRDPINIEKVKRNIINFLKEVNLYYITNIVSVTRDNIRVSFSPPLTERMFDIYKFEIARIVFQGVNNVNIYNFAKGEGDGYYSQIGDYLKYLITEALNFGFPTPMIIEDENSLTQFFMNPEEAPFGALADNFQFSLGLHLRSRIKNTLIMGIPERGGRHGETEHHKIGEPFQLYSSLFYTVKNYGCYINKES